MHDVATGRPQQRRLVLGLDTFTAHLASFIGTPSAALCYHRNLAFWSDYPRTWWIEIKHGLDRIDRDRLIDLEREVDVTRGEPADGTVAMAGCLGAVEQAVEVEIEPRRARRTSPRLTSTHAAAGSGTRLASGCVGVDNDCPKFAANALKSSVFTEAS